MKPFPNRAAISSRPITPLWRRTWLSKALWIGFVAAILIASYVLYSQRPLTVDVAAVEADVPVRVFGLGTVEARVLSKVGFEVGATLVELRADHGDRVSEGQILARLSSGEQEAKLSTALCSSSRANALCVLDGQSPRAVYDGYGSCPLTVERVIRSSDTAAVLA